MLGPETISLLLAVAGVGLSLTGVNHGWAYGAVNVQPSGGGWGPWSPTMDIELDMGWWNVSSLVKTSAADVEVRDSTAGAHVLGVCMVIAYSLTAAAALYIAFLLTTHACGASSQAMMPSDIHKTTTLMMYTTAGSGAAILVFALALYTALAIGGHKAIKEKAESFGQEASLWPYPSWACLGAVIAGCCNLAAARLFQVSLENSAPSGYQYC